MTLQERAGGPSYNPCSRLWAASPAARHPEALPVQVYHRDPHPVPDGRFRRERGRDDPASRPLRLELAREDLSRELEVHVPPVDRLLVEPALAKAEGHPLARLEAPVVHPRDLV